MEEQAKRRRRFVLAEKTGEHRRSETGLGDEDKVEDRSRERSVDGQVPAERRLSELPAIVPGRRDQKFASEERWATQCSF